MEDNLQSKLKPEETLLWTGRPETFETLDATHKPAYLKKCVAVVIAVVALIAWYINSATSKGHSVDAVVIILFLLIGTYAIASDLLDANKLKNKTLYALTDMRMISLIGGSLEGVEYKNVDCYNFVEDEDGHVTLLCGEWPMEEKSRLRRTATIRGACNDANTGRCNSFAMYALDDVDTVKKIIGEHMAA